MHLGRAAKNVAISVRRSRRRSTHRLLGKASYVLAPALVAITLSFVHYRVGAGIPSGARLAFGDLYFLALTLNALAAFAMLYGLAIYYRRDSGVQVAIDLSGRPYAVFDGKFARTEVGGLATELVPHFFRSLGETLGAALHVSVTGENTHHMVEACFKGVGRALRQAIRREGSELPSTKGVL